MKHLEPHMRARHVIEDEFRKLCISDIQSMERADFVGRSVEELVSEVMSRHRLVTPAIGVWTKRDEQTWVHDVPRYDYYLRARLVDGDFRWLEVNIAGLRMVDCYWDSEAKEIVLWAKRPEAAATELAEKAEAVVHNLSVYAENAKRLEAKVKEDLVGILSKASERARTATDVLEAITYPLSYSRAGPLDLLCGEGQSELTISTASPRIPSAKALMAPSPVDSRRLYLEEKGYFEVIDACMSMANTIKRNPSTFRRFWSDAKAQNVQETPFRDVLLLGLNATFKGRATNETFNGIGKTDILLRVDDRDLFIAECKVWRGPKSYTDAVTQLLDRYVTWDLLRASVIMFMGNKDFTNTLKTLADATAQHAYCQRIEQQLHEGQQLRWLARHPSDPGRQDLMVTSIAMYVPNVVEEGE